MSWHCRRCRRRPTEMWSPNRQLFTPAMCSASTSNRTWSRASLWKPPADALPLLAFTMQRLFNDYSPERKLTIAQYDAIGGIGGSIDRALAEAQHKAGSAGADDKLRRLVVPGLATWDPVVGAAKRLVAQESDLIRDDPAPLSALVDTLVEARLLTRGAGTLEVAHEALLRRPKIATWIEEQKDALKLRDDVLKETKEWVEAGKHSKDLVRRGERSRRSSTTARARSSLPIGARRPATWPRTRSPMCRRLSPH